MKDTTTPNPYYKIKGKNPNLLGFTHYNPKLPVTGKVSSKDGGTGIAFNYHQAPPDPYIECLAKGDQQCFIFVNRGYMCKRHKVSP